MISNFYKNYKKKLKKTLKKFKNILEKYFLNKYRQLLKFKTN